MEQALRAKAGEEWVVINPEPVPEGIVYAPNVAKKYRINREFRVTE
ncbi:MAG: hypothetical protein WC552_07065 [Candidatus Omnitrophota bacterium]